MKCGICPKGCGVDRAINRGFCGAGENAHIARAALHFWEEPIISGTKGSGAIFFCGCNLSCIFCQNYEINHTMRGMEVNGEGLADIMLSLQAQGAHNINLVTPAPHVGLVKKAIIAAKRAGLIIPVVYNTNSYEKAETLRELNGLIDVYLPDLKYVSPKLSKMYSGAEDYFAVASKAIKEMYAQCGNIQTGHDGMAKKGVIIRHMVLPGSVDDTRKVLDYISAEYPKNIYISLMSQYVPTRGDLPKPLDRRLTKGEYSRALDYAILKGFDNVFTQKLNSADISFTPDFNDDVIFSPIEQANSK